MKIYIDRLKNGGIERIEERLSSSFLEIEEAELCFSEEVKVEGKVYLADAHLVAHLSIQTEAKLPCSICNRSVALPIAIRDHYFTEALEEIHGATYSLEQEVREAILLHIPQFIECEGGNCPERAFVKQFLSQKSPKQAPSPFADL